MNTKVFDIAINFTRSLVTLGFILFSTIAVIGCSSGDGNGGLSDSSQCDIPFEANLDSYTRIGGAATSVALVDENGTNWTLFNVANELRATQVGMAAGIMHSVEVEGYIRDIEVVTYPPVGGIRYALLAMGSEGIAVVDLTDLANMQQVSRIGVNYYQDGLIMTEGGGAIIGDDEDPLVIASDRGTISSLAVYDSDPASDEDPLQLLIANEDYGLHKTLLSNLIVGPELDEDGTTLLIDQEKFILQYAGENPWGSPTDLTLHNGKLFVAMGYLGMGIFDPETLEQVGRYNLYTDATVKEDWYIDLDVSAVVQGDEYLDDFTLMPNYLQANFEIEQIWKGDYDCSAFEFIYECAPWANFDRYGREYYKARKVDVATFNEGEPDEKTYAYIAYGLAGLVAVDVTGYDSATPPINAAANEWGDFLFASYLGYVPGVPANGPDTPTGTESSSLFPHLGWGMLKEAGVVDVDVKQHEDGTAEAYFSDHFAGLVVMSGAEDPAANWRQAGAPFDNDDQGVLGDHWPDYEFVTSYDMTGASEHETLPAWMSDSSGPDLLATGEVSGHGNALSLLPDMEVSALGQIDVVLTSGAGGVNFLDINDLDPATDPALSFKLQVRLASTDEIGADADGLPSQAIAIGHTEGVDSFRSLLFVADGPHGLSVWKVADEDCIPTDDVGLVANTLQDEYAVTNSSGETVYPTPHAFDVVLDTEAQKAMVLSQSLGLRLVSTTEVEAGQADVGSPLLLKPEYPDDIFEHNVDEGNVDSQLINRQDHAYDVVVRDNLAFVADGSSGVTVYDLNTVPDYVTPTGDHIVGTIGADTGNPLLGRATSLQLWNDEETGESYAFVAAGHAGIAVVNITNITDSALPRDERMTLVKIFEPIKMEDDKVGKADGRSVDVQIVDDHAFFTYDSFGVVSYAIADLIEPVPAGVEPTDLWRKTPDTNDDGLPDDYRPVAVYRFKLQDPALGGLAELEGWGGGALGMTSLRVEDQVFFYIGYGSAGVVKLDWTDPSAPVVLQHTNTVGEAMDVTVINGRIYVADNMGGIALLK
ncbi:MAG: hypothetical protein PVJ58_05915 [Chromatiales bacterium]|jgi:hypothetical protein